MANKGITTCQNCGATGTPGTICPYCGTMIAYPKADPPANHAKKEKTESEWNEYNTKRYEFFWRDLVQNSWIPEDIFENLKIVNVYDFWIPMFLWFEISGTDRENQIKKLREYSTDYSYLDLVPEFYSELNKVKVCIIDYEYRNAIYTYIYIDYNPCTPEYLAELPSKQDRDEALREALLPDEMFDQISMELSNFPVNEETIQNAIAYINESCEKAIDAIKPQSPKPIFDSDENYKHIKDLLTALALSFFIWYFSDSISTSLMLACIAIGWYYNTLIKAKKAKIEFIETQNKLTQEKKEQTKKSFEERIRKLQRGESLATERILCSKKISYYKNSVHVKKKSYLKYRKENPYPLSSCPNFYTIYDYIETNLKL